MDAVTVQKENIDTTVGELRSLNFLSETGVINYIGHTVYMCDAGQNIYRIPSQVLSRHMTPSFRIFTRSVQDAHTRKYTGDGRERPPSTQGFPVQIVHINVNYLLAHGYMYIEDLGVCLAFNRQDAVLHHRALPAYMQRHHKDITELFRTAICMAPFKVLCNDPHGKLKELCTVINGKVLSVEISRIRNEPEQCTVYIGSKPGEYTVHELSINDIVIGKNVYDLDHMTVGLFQSKDHALSFVVKSRSTGAVYTQKDLNGTVQNAIAQYRQKLDEIQYNCDREKQRADILREENNVLRARLMQQLEFQQKANEYQQRQTMNKLSLEKEEAKLAKEIVSNKSTVLGHWASVLKTTATIAPLILSLFTLWKSWDSKKSVYG